MLVLLSKTRDLSTAGPAAPLITGKTLKCLSNLSTCLTPCCVVDDDDDDTSTSNHWLWIRSDLSNYIIAVFPGNQTTRLSSVTSRFPTAAGLLNISTESRPRRRLPSQMTSPFGRNLHVWITESQMFLAWSKPPNKKQMNTDDLSL